MNAVLKPWLTRFVFLSLMTLYALPWADGISGTGKISRFGSIVLNGIHYDTTDSLIYLNGELGSEADLRVGHQVVVETDGINDVAVVVNQYDSARGAIDTIELDADGVGATLTLLSQSVRVDMETMLHNAALDALSPGDWVAVGGIRDSQGAIRATSLESLMNHSDAVVSGPVTALTEDSLHIGALSVVHEDLEELIEELALEVGQPVFVRGSFDGEQLFAHTITPAALATSDTIEMFVERLIEERDGVQYIDGYQLITTADTSFVNGSLALLAEDAHVQVTGLLNPQGILHASKVEFIDAAQISIEGEVDEIDLSQGIIRIGDVEATIDENVTMKDLRDHYRYFGPDSVIDRDEVRATLEKTEHGYRVKSLLRKFQSDRKLRAPVQSTNKWLARLSAADQDIFGLFNADEIKFNGKNTSLFGFLIKIRAGDNVEVEWDDDGRVVRVSGFTGDDDNDADEDNDD